MSYWSNRPSFNSPRRALYKWLSIVAPVLSLRLAQDKIIKELLEDVYSRFGRRPMRVLDIGCGAGQIHAQDSRFEFYGADIDGFPARECYRKGYARAVCYEDKVGLPTEPEWVEFDVALILQVNAHVPGDLFRAMVDTARSRLRPRGTLFIAAELDNDGICYRLMHWLSPSWFDRYVKWMDHSHFERQSRFEEKLADLNLHTYERHYIIGQFVPLIHIWAYLFGSVPYQALRAPSVIADVVLSLMDRLSIEFSDKAGKSLVVGYRIDL